MNRYNRGVCYNSPGCEDDHCRCDDEEDEHCDNGEELENITEDEVASLMGVETYK